MIACFTEPDAALTIVARAVAMKSALPRPHRARKATMPPMVSWLPANAAPMMMKARPTRRVRLAPMRLLTQPVPSMATPVTAR